MMLWFFMTFQADLYTMPFASEAQRDDEWAEPLFYPGLPSFPKDFYHFEGGK